MSPNLITSLVRDLSGLWTFLTLDSVKEPSDFGLNDFYDLNLHIIVSLNLHAYCTSKNQTEGPIISATTSALFDIVRTLVKHSKYSY
jgi:hypothetical protein